MKRIWISMAIVLIVLASASGVCAQTKPTPAELERWSKDRNAKALETMPCKQATWLLDAQQKMQPPEDGIHNALGWWGRGFIEGALYMIPGDAAMKKGLDFGISVDVVAAHIATYCYGHETETPFEAIQDLLLKVMK